MKMKFIPTLISIVAAILFAGLFYTMSDAEEQMLKALTISGFVTVAICLECGIGISFKDSHHTVNSFAASLLFLAIFIAEHCCFAAWGTSRAWLAITSGLLLVLYLLVIYGIGKAKM